MRMQESNSLNISNWSIPLGNNTPCTTDWTDRLDGKNILLMLVGCWMIQVLHVVPLWLVMGLSIVGGMNVTQQFLNISANFN